MAQHLFLLLLISSTCLLDQIWAQSNYTSIVSPLESDKTNVISLSYEFGKKQAVFYQIITNVTDATFVDLTNITILYKMQPYDLPIPQGSYNVNYNGNGNNIAVFGQVIDPCVFASPGASATLSFDITTNATSGDVTAAFGSFEVLGLQNATAFEYTSPAPISVAGDVSDQFQASRFYFLELNANGGENFGLAATSTEDIWLSIAGFGNCATYQFTNKSLYWSGAVPANNTVTSIVASNQTSYVWVWVRANTPASVTLTWTSLGSAPVTGSTPEQTPTQEPSTDLPTWALALLVVFGIVIAVLLIVVIVMCVKNRRRSTYQGV